ncbi:thioester reductase domain-containing protein, partial [Streptomyces sp. NPDC051320]|uniref:thioester reductase domain-containing protein n=1 Tax=Streptomyces sp. NPDC051320 TaxID=3154644 RepID=UPI00341B1030
IEAALTALPGVTAACATLREDQPGDKRLVAYTVAADGHPQATAADLHRALAQELPEHMVPSAFVTLDALPVTPNGKVDRPALPSPGLPTGRTTGRAPRTEREKILCAVFADTLGVPGVHLDDDFFALGGHSLLAVKLAQRIEERVGVRLSLRDIFAAPTVNGLQRLLDGPSSDREGHRAASSSDPQNDIRLAPDITRTGGAPVHARPAAPAVERRPLLTGGSGFLGAFLLRDLLESTGGPVDCLVRAADETDGARRLRANLERYGLWKEHYGDLIRPLPGDLSAPGLGLTDAERTSLRRRVGQVYHNGARVNFAAPYTELRGANVGGTEELLRIVAESEPSGMHYVSTTGVYAPWVTGPTSITETTPVGPVRDLPDGYSQSKCVAEGLVEIARRRGIPVTVYRPARISGDSHTGACQDRDLLWQFIKGCLQAQAFPEGSDESTGWVPVDYVSASVVALAGHRTQQDASDTGRTTFHLTNPEAPRLSQVFRAAGALGYVMQPLPPEQWRKRITTQPENAAQLLLGGHGPQKPAVEPQAEPQRFPRTLDSSFTSRATAAAGVHAPALTDETLRVYLTYFIRTGFLPTPGDVIGR